MNSIGFPDNPSLKQLQKYVKDLTKARGWDKNNDLELFLLFSEEVGELARAIRDYRGLYQEPGKDKTNLEEEFADVLSYLLDLANYFDIDLEEAMRKKDQKNASRTWN